MQMFTFNEQRELNPVLTQCTGEEIGMSKSTLKIILTENSSCVAYVREF